MPRLATKRLPAKDGGTQSQMHEATNISSRGVVSTASLEAPSARLDKLRTKIGEVAQNAFCDKAGRESVVLFSGRDEGERL